MKGLTGIIIAKNEEKMIIDCLKSISFCDEIVLVDGGSTDKTIDIAKKHNARVVSHTKDSFSEARNIGLNATDTNWVLYVDADERVSEELAKEILLAIHSEKEDAAYRVRRINYYFGKYEWPHQEHLERLFKKDKLEKWYGKLHESPKVDGKVGDLQSPLFHYTHRDLSSMLEKTIIWSDMEARSRFDAGHPSITWWRFPRVMITAFYESYIKQGGYKIGVPGLIESIYQAFSMFVTYAKLWELQQESKRNKI